MKANMRIDDIRKIGFNALNKSLGPDGMIRFLQQFDSGTGDYTSERHAQLASYDPEKIFHELKKQ